MLNVINNSEWTVFAITADWCKFCEEMKPVIDEYVDNVKDVQIVKLNVNDQDKEEFLKKIDFESLPYFAVFHKKAELNDDPVFKHFIGGEAGASKEVLDQILSMIRNYSER